MCFNLKDVFINTGHYSSLLHYSHVKLVQVDLYILGQHYIFVGCISSRIFMYTLLNLN